MRIDRRSSRLSFRKQRRVGCLSPTLLLGVVLGGLITLSWNWLGQWFSAGAPTNETLVDLKSVEAAFNQGDLDRAVELAQQMLAVEPDNTAARVLLVHALIYRSYTEYNRDADRDAALRSASAAAAEKPLDNDLQAAYAFALQASQQPATAVEVARKVLDRQPDHALARMALALAYSGVGSHDVALRESLRAVASPGWRVDTHRALALAYSGVGDYRNAIDSVERAIRLNDRLIPLYFERALYARQIGDADAATVAYFRVLALDSNNVKARFRLCELSSVLREREAAIDYCRQVTELAPAWPDGWYQLGREYFLQGNFRLAQQNLNRCSTLQVEQGTPVEERRFECWYLQGQAAEILGDCPALLATYNEYRAMANVAGLTQTWIYPPEGPTFCITPIVPTVAA
ncbi:MAG TPA: tetratricopeptide repeat protein [Spirillospora sp.]|nr:tetratricopeptide repeat protein [Spirillospora sp.]